MAGSAHGPIGKDDRVRSNAVQNQLAALQAGSPRIEDYERRTTSVLAWPIVFCNGTCGGVVVADCANADCGTQSMLATAITTELIRRFGI